MQKIVSILSIVGKILMGIALLSIFIMNVLMGYIMFAPDDLPKPFYLAYADTSASASGGGETSSQAATSEAGGSHATAGEATAIPAAATEEAVPGEGVFIELGKKVVNLADPGGRRFLQATVVLELARPPEPTLAPGKKPIPTAEGGAGTESAAVVALREEVNRRMPIINDAVTVTLSSKTFEEVFTLDGKEKLRAELTKTLNQRVPGLNVVAVYFTDFVVQ
jgi:flagellar FliL protein